MCLLLCFIRQLPARFILKIVFPLHFFLSSRCSYGVRHLEKVRISYRYIDNIFYFLAGNRMTFGSICEVSHYSIASICTRTIIGFSLLISIPLTFTVILFKFASFSAFSPLAKPHQTMRFLLHRSLLLLLLFFLLHSVFSVSCVSVAEPTTFLLIHRSRSKSNSTYEYL